MIDKTTGTCSLLILLGLLVCLGGCASTESMLQEDRDPLEPYNRLMFQVNDTLDKGAIKPLAKGYQAVLPEFIRNRVTNFFSNLGDISVIVNDALQGKGRQATMDFSRLVYNTTFGLGGLFDVATTLGLPKHNEDFGQTLGYWGVGEGYYLVLPFFGPSTTRDAWGVPVDNFLLNPVRYTDPLSLRYSLTGTNVVDKRANLLRVERAFEEAQVDPYSFRRQAYLQRRRELTYDGHPPQPKLEFEEPETPAPPTQ
ncbi:MAG: VacJ family lipoprotein [Candidatus Competibacteraceae bacterium]